MTDFKVMDSNLANLKGLSSFALGSLPFRDRLLSQPVNEINEKHAKSSKTNPGSWVPNDWIKRVNVCLYTLVLYLIRFVVVEQSSSVI